MRESVSFTVQMSDQDVDRIAKEVARIVLEHVRDARRGCPGQNPMPLAVAPAAQGASEPGSAPTADRKERPAERQP